MLIKRTKARLKLNQILRGKKTNFRVAGCLLFREYDAKEPAYYYWEEWELLGMENYDSWVEYDHYNREVAIYEPVRFYHDHIDPSNFKTGQTLDFEDPTEGKKTGAVQEIGEGEIIKIIGKNTHQVFEKEKMIDATLVVPNTKEKITIEKYNNREYDAYKKRVISKKEQKELFGKVLTPWNWGLIFKFIFWTLLGGFIFWNSFILPTLPCDPQTQTCERSSSGAYRHRSVFGGGGGGVGK